MVLCEQHKHINYDYFDWDMTPMESMGGYTSIDFLKRCYRYNTAKAGNITAARQVCAKCVNQAELQYIRRKYPESILLPVMSHDNMLALTLAIQIELPIFANVWNLNGEKRKDMSAMERILKKPVFKGNIQAGRSYIIVDDVVTQGGTIMSLRQLVHDSGGHVDGVVAMAYARGSKIIIPTYENIERFSSKFGDDIYDFFEEFALVPELTCLSNSQLRYLLTFSSVEYMRRKARKYF